MADRQKFIKENIISDVECGSPGDRWAAREGGGVGHDMKGKDGRGGHERKTREERRGEEAEREGKRGERESSKPLCEFYILLWKRPIQG